MTPSQLYADTMDKQQYFLALGYMVHVVWECEWEKRVKENPSIKKFLAVFFKSSYPPTQKLDHSMVLKSIRDGKFFGFIECDINVPESLRDKFSEMSPIFKNIDVSRKELSPLHACICMRSRLPTTSATHARW